MTSSMRPPTAAPHRRGKQQQIDFGKHFGHAARRRFRSDHAVVDVGRRQATPSSVLHEARGLS
jgi:hypothetical protein